MIKIFITAFFITTIVISYAQNTPEEYQKIYEERIKLERINDVYIPKDLDDAMKELDRLTNDKAAENLKASPEDTIASKLHFSLGRWMLINWSLDEGSRLSAYLKVKGLSFPDDMMDLLIRCWYRHISHLPLNENKLVENYIIKRKAEYLKKLKNIDTIHIEQKKK